jgi:hypothetical protein
LIDSLTSSAHGRGFAAAFWAGVGCALVGAARVVSGKIAVARTAAARMPANQLITPRKPNVHGTYQDLT